MQIHVRENLLCDLPTIRAGRYTHAVHELLNVNRKFDEVVVCIHRPSSPESFFMCNAVLRAGGIWGFRIEAGMLPDVGRARYYIFGVTKSDSASVREVIGAGTIIVKEVTRDTSPAAPVDVPGKVVIYDEDGAAHYLTAVPDGMGNFTSVVD